VRACVCARVRVRVCIGVGGGRAGKTIRPDLVARKTTRLTVRIFYAIPARAYLYTPRSGHSQKNHDS